MLCLILLDSFVDGVGEEGRVALYEITTYPLSQPLSNVLIFQRRVCVVVDKLCRCSLDLISINYFRGGS